jgi:predicted  nucleic acid-binding Zn-ribbon protein
MVLHWKQDAQKLRAEKDSLQKRVTESDEALAKAQAHIAEMKKVSQSKDVPFE